MNRDWRGEWMSLADLSRLMGKEYDTVRMLHRSGAWTVPGIRFHRVCRRIWVQIDRQLYDTLSVSPKR